MQYGVDGLLMTVNIRCCCLQWCGAAIMLLDQQELALIQNISLWKTNIGALAILSLMINMTLSLMD